MKTVAGIDLGTQSMKVVIYDYENHNIIEKASCPVELISADDNNNEQNKDNNQKNQNQENDQNKDNNQNQDQNNNKDQNNNQDQNKDEDKDQGNNDNKPNNGSNSSGEKQHKELSHEQERMLDVIQGEEDKTQDKIKDAERGTIVYGKKNW